MKKSYKDENKDLINSFLENTFFTNWRQAKRNSKKELEFSLPNYSSVELALGHACDLKCKYCYYSRFGKELYQNEKVDGPTVVKNVEKFMNFLLKNNMVCEIDIFSGEAFVLPYIWDVLDVILDYQTRTPIEKRVPAIVVPTNLSFLKSHNLDKLEKVRNYIEKFKAIDITFGLSGSFDGPFMDNLNRPFVNTKNNYTEKFYSRFVEELSDMNLGAHPMVYSNNIEYWIENLLWFINETRSGFYLLEVRNGEWTAEQSAQIYYMTRFAINYIHKIYRSIETDEIFPKFVQNANNGFNMLNSVFGTIGRGFGCSLQSTLNLNMHNLTLIPCHRTSYEHLTTGKFDFKEDGSYEFEPINVEMYLAEQASESTDLAPCTACPIKGLCGGTCLGSNLESTGDLFTIPPTFCMESHARVAGIIKGWEDVGWLDYYYKNLDPVKKAGIKFLLNEYKDM